MELSNFAVASNPQNDPIRLVSSDRFVSSDMHFANAFVSWKGWHLHVHGGDADSHDSVRQAWQLLPGEEQEPTLASGQVLTNTTKLQYIPGTSYGSIGIHILKLVIG